mgnify:CR=1 FL=1
MWLGLDGSRGAWRARGPSHAAERRRGAAIEPTRRRAVGCHRERLRFDLDARHVTRGSGRLSRFVPHWFPGIIIVVVVISNAQDSRLPFDES